MSSISESSWTSISIACLPACLRGWWFKGALCSQVGHRDQLFMFPRFADSKSFFRPSLRINMNLCVCGCREPDAAAEEPPECDIKISRASLRGEESHSQVNKSNISDCQGYFSANWRGSTARRVKKQQRQQKVVNALWVAKQASQPVLNKVPVHFGYLYYCVYKYTLPIPFWAKFSFLFDGLGKHFELIMAGNFQGS